MTAAILMPFGGADCEYRRRARDWMVDWYRRSHPDWALCFGESGDPWSKGAAIADALRRTTADVLVLADADSFLLPDVLDEAVSLVEAGAPWVIPHDQVFRLTPEETDRVYEGAEPDLRNVVRPAYRGPPGGGISVLTRKAYDTAGGIDPRFLGWGGEDLALGWMLSGLVGWYQRLNGHLIHLWHPHPAPDLRGSPASEALVARYRIHRRNPDGMRMLLKERELGSSSPPAAHGDGHQG